MIRHQKLGHVELGVTDLERSKAFYVDVVGLEFVGTRGDGSVKLRCDEDEYSLVLTACDEPGLKLSAWELESEEQFKNLHSALSDAGVEFQEVHEAECTARGIGRATRLREPATGAALEFYIGPDATGDYSFAAKHTKIQRLGHVVFNSPDQRATVDFFRDVLNFRESDIVDDGGVFLRPFPNPFHHGIGVAQAPGAGFNHLNFMVTEIDDIGKALGRFRREEVQIVWGPGRHPVSDSIFLYFLDPDGLTLEYSFGMEEFPEVDARGPRTLQRSPENSDAWASVRLPAMGAVGVIHA